MQMSCIFLFFSGRKQTPNAPQNMVHKMMETELLNPQSDIDTVKDKKGRISECNLFTGTSSNSIESAYSSISHQLGLEEPRQPCA